MRYVGHPRCIRHQVEDFSNNDSSPTYALITHSRQVSRCMKISFADSTVDDSYRELHKVNTPAEGKVIPHHSPPVPIWMVKEARSAARNNKPGTHLEAQRELEILRTPSNCDHNYTTVPWLVPLHVMYRTPVLVSMQAARIIEVIPWNRCKNSSVQNC